MDFLGDYDFIFNTGADPVLLASSKFAIIDKTRTICNSNDMETFYHGITPPDAKVYADVYPIVVLLNGPSGSGKSTFCTMVQRFLISGTAMELSTVDPVYGWAEMIFCKSYSDIRKIYKNPESIMSSPDYNRQNKTTEYRTLMHNLKKAWTDVYDGPNIYVLNKVLNLVKKLDSEIIFINVREKSNIDKLIAYLTKMGLINMTVYIDNGETMKSREKFADGDSYKYDITIPNKHDISELMVRALMFATSIYKLNHVFGVPRALNSIINVFADGQDNT